MGTEGRLRWLIDKWLTPAAGRRVRLTRYSYPGTSHHRCIRIESSRTTGPFELFFFRHEDGPWRVFPSVRARPMMGRYGRVALLGCHALVGLSQPWHASWSTGIGGVPPCQAAVS
jgi:hypothetical protein